MVDGRLEQPARLSPGLLDRLAEPLFGLYRDMADRMAGAGEVDVSLMIRRRLVELLGGLTGRLGDPARLQLASALTDLGHDLLEYGRVDEADAVVTEAAVIEQAVDGARTAVAEPAHATVSRGTQAVTWIPLSPTASYAATTASAAGPVDLTMLQVERQAKAAGWLEAHRGQAHQLELEYMEQAQIEAERREAARVEADRSAAAQLAAERARIEEAERLEAARRAAAEDAERLERKRRREERIEAHRLEVERQEAERSDAERLEAERRADDLISSDPAEAERLELERLQAEIEELERAEKRGQAEGEQRG